VSDVITRGHELQGMMNIVLVVWCCHRKVLHRLHPLPIIIIIIIIIIIMAFTTNQAMESGTHNTGKVGFPLRVVL